MQMQKFISNLARCALRVLASLTVLAGLVVALLIHRPKALVGVLYAALVTAGVAGCALLAGALVCGMAARRRERRARQA